LTTPPKKFRLQKSQMNNEANSDDDETEPSPKAQEVVKKQISEKN
jgi:hypothetical protein